LTAGTQVFVYPEELRFVTAEALAAQVAEIGCDAVSMALVYHRGRRVLARHRHVSTLGRTTAYFSPELARYGELGPPVSCEPSLQQAVLRFRDACAANGVSFRAWIVALHDEALAAAWPAAAAAGLDGSALGHSLCPSAPAALEYVAMLAGDVAAQVRPDAVDLEAWLYPAWEPSYTLTLALQPLGPRATLLAAQCFCSHCRLLIGSGAAETEQLVRSVAGAPFSDGDGFDDADLLDAISGARATGAARLAAAVASAVREHGVPLRVFASGDPAQARLQGLSPAAVAHVDGILFGCARLAGDELLHRFGGLRALAGTPAAPTVSTNWAPERTPAAMAEDVRRLVEVGARGLALYNLSLVPEAGLDAFRAATAAFRAARPA
jgi:hypothetical protein